MNNKKHVSHAALFPNVLFFMKFIIYFLIIPALGFMSFLSGGQVMDNWETIHIPGVCTFKAPGKIVSAGEISKLAGKHLTDDQFKKFGIDPNNGSFDEIRKIVTGYNDKNMLFQPLDQLLGEAPRRGADYRYFSMNIKISDDPEIIDGQEESKSATKAEIAELAEFSEELVRMEAKKFGMKIISFKSLGVRKINGTWVLWNTCKRSTERSEFQNCVHFITVLGKRKGCSLTITCSTNPQSIWYQSLDKMLASMDFDIFLDKKPDPPKQERTVIDGILDKSELVDSIMSNKGVPEDWVKYSIKGMCSIYLPRKMISIYDETKKVVEGENIEAFPFQLIKEHGVLKDEIEARLGSVNVKKGIVDIFVDKDLLFKDGPEKLKSFLTLHVWDFPVSDELNNLWKTESPNIANRELEALDKFLDPLIQKDLDFLSGLTRQKIKVVDISPLACRNYNNRPVLMKSCRYHHIDAPFLSMVVDFIYVKNGDKILNINLDLS